MKPANVLLEPQSNGISLHALIVKTPLLLVYVCNFAESADEEVSVSENSHSTLEQHQRSPVSVSSPGPQAEPYGKFITLHCMWNELVPDLRCTYIGNIGGLQHCV